MVGIRCHIMVMLDIMFRYMTSNAPVHPVVDYRVDAGLTHGEPVEQQVDVANVGALSEAGSCRYSRYCRYS